MSQMRVASGTPCFGACVKQLAICKFIDCLLSNRGVEAWPASTGVIFGFRTEQGSVAAHAFVNAISLLVPVGTGKGAFGSVFAGDMKLFRRQLRPPFFICFCYSWCLVLLLHGLPLFNCCCDRSNRTFTLTRQVQEKIRPINCGQICLADIGRSANRPCRTNRLETRSPLRLTTRCMHHPIAKPRNSILNQILKRSPYPVVEEYIIGLDRIEKSKKYGDRDWLYTNWQFWRTARRCKTGRKVCLGRTFVANG